MSATGEVYAGGMLGIGFKYAATILKLNSDGNLATNFGTAGVAQYPSVNKGTAFITDMMLEDTRLVFIGSSQHRIKGLLEQSITLAEFDGNGLALAGVGVSGRNLIANTASGDCQSLMLSSSGTALVGGYLGGGVGYFAEVAN